jgi:hypothetical protein
MALAREGLASRHSEFVVRTESTLGRSGFATNGTDWPISSHDRRGGLGTCCKLLEARAEDWRLGSPSNATGAREPCLERGEEIFGDGSSSGELCSRLVRLIFVDAISRTPSQKRAACSAHVV